MDGTAVLVGVLVLVLVGVGVGGALTVIPSSETYGPVLWVSVIVCVPFVNIPEDHLFWKVCEGVL